MKNADEKPRKKKEEARGYKPLQPIHFSHSIHSGEMGIDCKYCHNTVTESKSAGLPSIHVCMNCHKTISGETNESKKKIQKIYDAAGWDGSTFTRDTAPIVWNRVHHLPDSVNVKNGTLPDGKSSATFSHAKHLQVSNLDCKACHGDLTKNDPQDLQINENACLKCHY